MSSLRLLTRLIRHPDSTGTDGSAFESSTEPKPSAATNGHQPVSEGESSAQDPHTLEQTRRIAKLEASLATAERQVAESQRAKSQADRRWDSQLGQLRAAERDARDLRGANSDVARHMKARNEAEHKMNSQRGELERAKDKIAWLERELRAANGRIARLEAPLEKKDRVSVIARRR